MRDFVRWAAAFGRYAAGVAPGPAVFLLLCGLAGLAPLPAAAQSAAPAAATPAAARAAAAALPGFFDPRHRPDRPDPVRRPPQIRFVATDDFPPFSFRGPDGLPTGLNVDLARAICLELKVQCTLEIKPFEALVPALNEGTADAAIAGIAVTAENRTRVDFSERYFRSPARFLARRADAAADIRPETVAGKSVGVVAGTAHEAYLKDFFPKAALKPYPDAEALRGALKRGEVAFIFADGVASTFWLNGTGSEGCCVFVGGPFTESRYFGEGLSIAVKKDNDVLRQSVNYALNQLWEKGVYADLYLRWFPISVY